VGSLKLLQDLHNKNKSSQTRLRFDFFVTYPVNLLQTPDSRMLYELRIVLMRPSVAGLVWSIWLVWSFSFVWLLGNKAKRARMAERRETRGWSVSCV
jgi:hypothetical protein